MLKERLKVWMDGAVVVAHPDDETLWCGGLVLRFPLRWTIICCSIPRKDPERAWKFFDACRALGADGRLLPFTESNPNERLGHLDALDMSRFHVVVTHGAAGEYGHRHHLDVHAVVTAQAGDRTILIGQRKGGNGEHVLELTEAERERKLAALRCYDHAAPDDRGKPKWQALLDRYGREFDFGRESYDFA